MKSFKKVLAFAVSLVMVFSAFAAVMSVSASAAGNSVAYKMSAIDRHYGWGEWAQSVSYTSNGWLNLKDEGRFRLQYQVAFVPTKAENNQLKAALRSSVSNTGLLNCDVLVNSYAITDKEKFKSNDTEQAGVMCNVVINYRYKYGKAIDNTIDSNTGKPKNPEGWVTDSFKKSTWAVYNKLATIEIPVDDYAQFDESFEDEYDKDYSDFEITSVIFQANNYSVNGTESVMAFKGTQFNTGTKGLGYVDVDFSPLYLNGTTCPAKGTNLGADFEFIENATDPKGLGTFKFISAKKEIPQVEDASQHGGPYGAGSDIDRTKLATVVYGDANGDGALNMKDVLLMRKKIAGWKVDIDAENADVNSDGSLNMKDVLLLRKKIAGWKVAPWN